jgi:hypothetical protein
METWTRPPVGSTERQLARELGMVRSAIAMVAAHAAQRVTVAGLRFGAELLPVAGRLALEAGVRARPLWREDGAGADIAVELIRD